MLEPIYRLNRWYDRLDDEHGILRFLLFMIPMTIFNLMIWFGPYRVMCAGVVGMGAMGFLRLLPVLVPHRR